MRWSEVKASACPVAQGAAVVGDRWTLLILREALFGARRYEAFRTALGISPHLLSTRLSRLVDEGVLRHDTGGDYRLTPAGRALQPVVLALAAWSNAWRAGPDGPATTYVHAACGCAFTPTLSCSACGETVDGREVETRFGPALAAERAVRR